VPVTIKILMNGSKYQLCSSVHIKQSLIYTFINGDVYPAKSKNFLTITISAALCYIFYPNIWLGPP